MRLPPESLIQFSLEKMRQRLHTQQQKGYTGPVRSGLIYAGNIHDAIPRQLLLDSRLSPVDKLAWMMIRLHAQQNDGAIFPTYDELQLQLATPHSHKASRETVSRALLMLRITGWLSLCNRVRDSKGRVRGNIYMQHDEPLNAYDAETLDPRWLDLVEKSSQHKNKSVRCVARATIQALKTDPSMRHQHTRVALIEQRLGGVQSPEQMANRQRFIVDQKDKETKKKRTQVKKPGSKIELSHKNADKEPGSKIELSPQSQSGSVVRKSNYNVRSFTQSVKDTYVGGKPLKSKSGTSPLMPDEIRKGVTEQDAVMLESQLRQLPAALSQSIVFQLSQGLRKGTVRNLMAYALTLLKSARDGNYINKPMGYIYNFAEAPDSEKTRSAGPTLMPTAHAEKSDASAITPGQRRTSDPELARRAINKIRRKLAGVSAGHA